MGLFGIKKNKKEDEVNKKPVVSKKKEIKKTTEDLSWVINKPHITEKAAILAGESRYTFNVSPKANKIEVRKAIEQIYNVIPISVNIVNEKSRKTKKYTNHGVVKATIKGTRKAIVKLRGGDKIEFV